MATPGLRPSGAAGAGASALRGHLPRLAAGFRIRLATAYRYIRETVDLLACLAPTLRDAVQTARAKAYVTLDGTLLPIDRVAADRPYSSGKHKRHAMNVQVLADPLGRLIWASPALPGAAHDLTAARTHGIIAALTGAGVGCGRTRATRVPAAP